MGGTLKERKQQAERREAEIFLALAGRKRTLADAKREKRRRKKPVSELLSRLSLAGVSGNVLRPAETYVPKSHNLDRQLMGLLDHLFVQYSVPGFLYAACLADGPDAAQRPPRGGDEFARMAGVYRQWFITLAQGGSFPKLVKGVMTSREAAMFLRAPWGRQIHENVWWAKMAVAGIPEAVIGRLIDRIFTDHLFADPDGRLAEAIQFYARHHPDLDRDSFDAVTDFLAHALRHDPQFRLKGRTASSVVRLSEQWHLQMQRARLGRHVEWNGLRVVDWLWESKTELWEVTELRDNKALINEGRKQKHCVYSYVQRCVEGRSAIFSLRAYRKIAADYDAEGRPVWDRDFEMRRVTLEVGASRAVVQVRGPLNRPPTPEERDVLRRWAGEKGITLPARA